jgi:16S rRNA C967 or C1407 C5-methylase (RsmB/RsmF family)
LEKLHGGIDSKIPKGFVIANDFDPKRAYLLAHQSRRINSPSLFVTNNDA